MKNMRQRMFLLLAALLLAAFLAACSGGNPSGGEQAPAGGESSAAQTSAAPDHQHEFAGEWVVVKEPTATEEGKRYNSCVICGQDVVEVIPPTGKPTPTLTTPEQPSDDPIPVDPTQTLIVSTPMPTPTPTTETPVDPSDEPWLPTIHTHSFGEWKTVLEQTCLADGTKERVCVCGEKITETIPAIGAHTWGDPVFTWDDYSAAAKRFCTVCGGSESVDVTMSDSVTKQQTCTEMGTKVYTATASVGGKTYTDSKTETFAAGHNYVDNICTMCGEKKPSDGLKYTLNYDGKYYTVEKGTCTDDNVVIPASYNGKPVTSIGEAAFSECASLTSITIPDSVTEIGAYAFAYSRSLASVTIPDGVTDIYGGAFYNCSSLTSVTIPDSVTSIGSYAFSGCSSISSMTVASGNTKYHSAENCIIETASKTLIAGCKNSVIPDDGSVTSIGLGAFSDCSSLTSVTIPDSVTEIGDSAFAWCTSLTSVTIGNSVTSIGKYAFNYCTSLTSVTIPDSVTEIGDYAFVWCTSLKTVYYRGSSAQWSKISIESGNDWLYHATKVYNYTGE